MSLTLACITLMLLSVNHQNCQKYTHKMQKYFNHDNLSCHTVVTINKMVIPQCFCIHYAKFIWLHHLTTVFCVKEKFEKGTFHSRYADDNKHSNKHLFCFCFITLACTENNYCSMKVHSHFILFLKKVSETYWWTHHLHKGMQWSCTHHR